MKLATPFVIAFVMFAGLTTAAHAQATDGSAEQLDQMRRQMAELQAQLEEAQRRLDELKDAEQANAHRDQQVEDQRVIDRSRAPRPVTSTTDRPADLGDYRVGPLDDKVDESGTIISSSGSGSGYTTYTVTRRAAPTTVIVRQTVPVATGPVIFSTGTYYPKPVYRTYYPYHHGYTYYGYRPGAVYHHGYHKRHYRSYGGVSIRYHGDNWGIAVGKSRGYHCR